MKANFEARFKHKHAVKINSHKDKQKNCKTEVSQTNLYEIKISHAEYIIILMHKKEKIYAIIEAKQKLTSIIK